MMTISVKRRKYKNIFLNPHTFATFVLHKYPHLVPHSKQNSVQIILLTLFTER